VTNSYCQHFQVTTMDASREELPRVSVHSPEDWSRIKKNFANAVLTQMYLRLSAAGSSLRRDVLALHMNQVWRRVKLSNMNF
jgi:hypothetical protein